MKDTIVISVGGSIVAPGKPDANFLKKFNTFVRSYLKKYRFVFVIGGGKTARNYIEGLSKVIGKKPEAMDWMGISATHLNAFLVKSIFHDVAYKEVIKDPRRKVKFDKVLIAGGWKPGFTTDFDAVMLAKQLGAKTVINMSNISYLYDKDPRKNKSAKKIEKIGWDGFKKIVGDKHRPGVNVPFDPIATKLAAKSKLRLVIMSNDLKNLKNLLDGKNFKGSVVE